MLHPSDRPGLKQQAKAAMRKATPGIYLVSFVVLLLTNLPSFVTEGPTIQLMLQADSPEQMMEIYQSSAVVTGSIALFLATLAMSIFLNLVTFGYQLYTLRISREEEPGGLETLFACFQQFWRFFRAILLMTLFTFLWSLLFVIPGIIAAIAYSQTIYIMLDNPDMSPREAIAASRQMMRGHKLEYFILDLSFWGWIFLSPFTLNLLLIWVHPYMHVTYANYYNALSGWQKVVPEESSFTAEPEEWWNQ